jgi:hypothetical protein
LQDGFFAGNPSSQPVFPAGRATGPAPPPNLKNKKEKRKRRRGNNLGKKINCDLRAGYAII